MRTAVVVFCAVLTLGLSAAAAATPTRADLTSLAREARKSGAPGAFAHPPNFAPGTNWSYSNTNYIVLGLVVEALTGKPLGQVLEERIFTPLGLTSSSFPLTIDLAPDFVHGYIKLPATPLFDVSPG